MNRPKTQANDLELQIPPARSILVALSGGPDSTLLLHLLLRESKSLKFKLLAAHINYRLRHKDSDTDEAFCRDLCKKLGVKLFVKKLSTGAMAKSNLQENARRIRYEYFDELCEKHDIDFIATGHNRDDNVETFIMNLGRGAGTFGLGGINPREGNIIRPLLNYSRTEIESYLKANKIKFRTDGSNLETNYLRNRVRLQLLPQMASLFGEALPGNIHRAARLLSEQEHALRQIADELIATDARTTAGGKIVLDLDKFHLYYPMLQRLVIALCYERLHGSLKDFDFRTSERVLEVASGSTDLVDLKAGIFAERCDRVMYIYRRSLATRPVAIKRTGKTKAAAFWAEFSFARIPRASVNRDDLRSGQNLRVYFDAAKLRGQLTVRSVREGDKFSPLGMSGHRKLSDLLIDAKVDRPLRDEIPIVLCDDKIVWVVGLAICEDYKVTDTTKTVVQLEVKPYRGI